MSERYKVGEFEMWTGDESDEAREARKQTRVVLMRYDVEGAQPQTMIFVENLWRPGLDLTSAAHFIIPASDNDAAFAANVIRAYADGLRRGREEGRREAARRWRDMVAALHEWSK